MPGPDDDVAPADAWTTQVRSAMLLDSLMQLALPDQIGRIARLDSSDSRAYVARLKPMYSKH